MLASLNLSIYAGLLALRAASGSEEYLEASDAPLAAIGGWLMLWLAAASVLATIRWPSQPEPGRLVRVSAVWLMWVSIAVAGLVVLDFAAILVTAPVTGDPGSLKELGRDAFSLGVAVLLVPLGGLVLGAILGWVDYWLLRAWWRRSSNADPSRGEADVG